MAMSNKVEPIYTNTQSATTERNEKSNIRKLLFAIGVAVIVIGVFTSLYVMIFQLQISVQDLERQIIQKEHKDINECTSGTHNCHQHATCINTLGSFLCFCNANYTGTGRQCDINECTSGTHNCHQHATCINTLDSFLCICNANYTGTGRQCAPNFCSANVGLCQHGGTCWDTATRYSCSCNIWHTGKHCERAINHVIMTTPKNWADARKYCQSIGGDLATWGMRNATVRNWTITNLLKTRPAADYWIGLTDLEEEGVWKYIDGVPITTVNTDFKPGEPNGGTYANCGHLYHRYQYEMDDTSCDRIQLAICERKFF